MFPVRKYFVFLIVYFYWSDIQTVGCVDKLDFWVPDPKFNARRSNDNHQKHIQNKLNYHKSRKTTVDKSAGDQEEEGDNIIEKVKHQHSSLRSNNQEPNRTRNIKRNRYAVLEEGKGDRQRVLRHGREQEHEDIVKVRSENRFKYRKDRQILRSTRMTPMYLMQQSPEQTKPKPKKQDIHSTTLSSYSITKQLDRIMAGFENANSTVEIVGRTAAYNDIVLVKITERKLDEGTAFRADESKYVDEKPEKKIIFIVHGLSTMGIDGLMCLNLENEFSKLVSYYLEHLDKFDIFLIPLANPDGYEIKNILWNKNMSPQNACPGVSLDRNFDIGWNTSKQMSSCSQNYPGPSPFSEPETVAIRDVFHHFSQKIIAYIHVHSASLDHTIHKGEAVLYPKGYTDSQSDDDKYLDLRGEIDEAMKNASFQITSVTVDTLYNWYGKVSGTSVDYASAVYGIPFAMEFVMQPYELIKGTSKETLNTIALKEIWKRMIDVIFNNIWRSTLANEAN